MSSVGSDHGPACPDLIPQPRRLQVGAGRFVPGKTLTFWAAPEADPAARLLGDWLAARGIGWQRVDQPDAARLRLVAAPAGTASEAYRLAIQADSIVVGAAAAPGFSHAVQTLLALALDYAGMAWPVVTIDDAPHFEWRGLLLDSCRTFISKAAILRLLDQMAALKLNRLHWHLTDDQGWRLEIKRYPKLTEIGAWRVRDGVREGGFYTQADIREIVAFAAARGIAIMPEIEMPGHATAALAAYPDLGCGPGQLSVGTAWGIYPNNYNAGDDRVFTFLEDVLHEVMELFPFPYIHLGADECLKDQWKASAECQRRIAAEQLGDEHGLQTYFINRIAEFLHRHGRTAVGWDEVLEGPITKHIVVQCWRDEAVIKVALARGYRIIAAPRRHCYFDIAVSQVDLTDVYAFDPSMGLADATGVIGGEATLWTEHIAESEMDHMLFPRLFALAETLWAGPAAKEATDRFVQRARRVTARWRSAGVNAGPMLRDDAPAETMKGRKDLHVPPAGLDQIGLGG